MSLRAGLGQRGGHPGRSQQVDLHRVVEGRVEVDGGRRVDHDVAVGQHGPPVVVEPDPVDAHVAGHGGDSPVGHLVVGLAGVGLAALLAELAEGVVAQHVALHAGRRAPPPRPHDQHQLAVGHAAQQALGERGPQEPGRAGDGDALAGQRLDDHGVSSTVRRH